ncbi:type VI secretion system tube protein TssD, partial [Escherichia coli]
KLIDKSSPLLSNAINQNERLFIEIDLYRINKSGRWERYYYIQLRNASLTAIHVNISDNNLPTECVTVDYDYILCKHLIANTEFDWLAFPAGYNSLFIPPKSPPASNLKPEPLPVVN